MFFYRKHPICSISIHEWKCYCGHIIKVLQKQDEFFDIYPNYAAFLPDSPMCEKIILELPSGHKVEDQFIAHCYGRPSVVLKTTFPLFYNHFKEIGFYCSESWKGLFIFKRKQNTNLYSLLHIKNDFRNFQISCKPEILNYPPPFSTPLTYLFENLNADGLRSAETLLLHGEYVCFLCCNFYLFVQNFIFHILAMSLKFVITKIITKFCYKRKKIFPLANIFLQSFCVFLAVAACGVELWSCSIPYYTVFARK